MSPTEELLAPPTLPPPEENKWRSEQRAFHRLLPDLLKTHYRQFVAIHNGQVVESGPDKLEVAARAYARFGYVPIFVTLVAEQAPVIRVPSPRVVGSERSA